MSEKIRKIVVIESKKGAAARPLTTAPAPVPFREGAKAPQVTTPANVPTTSGPVSVTKPTK